MGTLLKLVFVILSCLAVLFFLPTLVPQMNKTFSAGGMSVSWAVLSAVVLGSFGLLYLKVSHK